MPRWEGSVRGAWRVGIAGPSAMRWVEQKMQMWYAADLVSVTSVVCAAVAHPIYTERRWTAQFPRYNSHRSGQQTPYRVTPSVYGLQKEAERIETSYCSSFWKEDCYV